MTPGGIPSSDTNPRCRRQRRKRTQKNWSPPPPHHPPHPLGNERKRTMPRWTASGECIFSTVKRRRRMNSHRMERSGSIGQLRANPSGDTSPRDHIPTSRRRPNSTPLKIPKRGKTRQPGHFRKNAIWKTDIERRNIPFLEARLRDFRFRS